MDDLEGDFSCASAGCQVGLRYSFALLVPQPQQKRYNTSLEGCSLQGLQRTQWSEHGTTPTILGNGRGNTRRQCETGDDRECLYSIQQYVHLTVLRFNVFFCGGIYVLCIKSACEGAFMSASVCACACTRTHV